MEMIFIDIFTYFKQKIGVTDLEGELLKTNGKITNILEENNKNLVDINVKLDDLIDSYYVSDKEFVDVIGKLKEINTRLKLKLADSDFETLMDSKYVTTHLYYTKRYIFNKETKVTLPVIDFIKSWDCLPTFNSLKDVFEKKIIYTSDKTTSEVGDFWEFPPEIIANGYKSDCESSTFLRIALADKLKTPIYAGLGMYKGTGHCYCIYLKENQLYIIESTNNRFLPIKIPNNDISKTISGYTTYYVFSGKKVWKINQDKTIHFGSDCLNGIVEND